MVLRGEQFHRSGLSGCALLTRQASISSYTDKFERRVCAVACVTGILSVCRTQTRQYGLSACPCSEGKHPWSFNKGLASDGARG